MSEDSDVVVGGFNIPSFYHRNKLLQNMEVSDDLIDHLGEQFQYTRCKHERGWTFDEWARERIGLTISLGPDFNSVKADGVKFRGTKFREVKAHV